MQYILAASRNAVELSIFPHYFSDEAGGLQTMNQRYTDEQGNSREVFEVENCESSTFFLPPPNPADFTIEDPINIVYCGSNIWRKGARQCWNRTPIFAVELVTAGNMHLIQDGKEYIIEKGMAYTLRVGTAVEMKVGDKGFMHKRFVDIAGPNIDALRENCGLTDSDILVLTNPSRLCALMRNATRLLRTRPENYIHSLALVAFDILLTLRREIGGTRYPPAVNAVLNLFSRKIEHQVTIEEMCSVACLSRPQLHRVFKKHLADTPLNYFSKMRIRHAAMALHASPQRTIGDIARQYAFEDQAHFSNLFRKVMGISPTAYRRGESSLSPGPHRGGHEPPAQETVSN